MKIVRTYKTLFNTFEPDSSSLYIGLNYTAYNVSTTKFLAPIKCGGLLFHTLVSSDTNQLIKYYNEGCKVNEFVEIQNVILDLETNIYIFLQNLQPEVRDYIHPKRLEELGVEHLKKLMTLLISRSNRTPSFTVLLSEKFKKYIGEFSDIGIIDDSFISQLRIQSPNFQKNERTTKLSEVEWQQFVKLSLSKSDKYLESCKKHGVDIVNKQVIEESKVIYRNHFCEYFINFYTIFKYCADNKIACVIKGSGASSLLLYLWGFSIIDPLQYQLPFSRFLNDNKLADIDVDIPSDKRDEVLVNVNKLLFEKYGTNVIYILNSSSKNYNKFTEHPSGFLIESKNVSIPLSTDPDSKKRYSELYNSSTYPILEKLGYLKYDLLRSLLLQDLNTICTDNKLDFQLLLHNWDKIKWNTSFQDILLKKDIFQLNSDYVRGMIKLIKPTSYQQLVNIIACNRPALTRIEGFTQKYLCQQISKPSRKFKDKELQKIFDSSNSGDLLLYQDQIIDILTYILPHVDQQKIMKLVKARGVDLSKYKTEFIEKLNSLVDDLKFSTMIWTIIENFGTYGLNKAHSYVYGIMSYIQLYLESIKK